MYKLTGLPVSPRSRTTVLPVGAAHRRMHNQIL